MRRRRRGGGDPDGPPLCVLLLPARQTSEAVEPLLAAPGTVAVEPAALGYGVTARLPGLLRERTAAGQARRMALPGRPRAIVVFDARQYPLARALLAAHPEAELWLAREAAGDEAAAARAAVTFSSPEALWEPMETLGIESGRLGSERR